jgi:2-keto-3-deoxy-L-fuconate dehydrogenase
MAVRLQGKRILVTAAAQGIGRAAALAFAAEGAEVTATDRDAAAVATLAAETGGEIRVRRLDVTDAKAIDELARDDAFTVILNCAGVVPRGTVLDCTDEQWDLAWKLNVGSMFRITRALLPAMIAAGGGSIINMSSVASSVRGVPDRFAYGTTKAAVIGLTKAIAADFVHQQVRCNAICPGTVQTPSLESRIAEQADRQRRDTAAVRAEFIQRQPMSRFGRASEVAALAVYLASDESAFTTGTIHVIDGGWCT